MKSFKSFMLLVEGPGAPPPAPGGDMGGAMGGLPGGAPPMGGGMPPMGGGMGGGMGGPPMGGMGGPGPGAGGPAAPMPSRTKDVWKALELAMEELGTKGGHSQDNLVQNKEDKTKPEKKHLLGTPGY